MERGIEKSDNRGRGAASLASTLDALAVVSVVAVACGAVMSALGAPWPARCYVSILLVLFDLVFAYEFFAHALGGRRPFPFLEGLASVVPLLLVSGPFISGWLLSDLGAAAVRGFAYASPPLGGLATVAALRLLRAARPFRASETSSAPGRAADTQTDRARAGRRLAATAAVAVVLLGAAASDAGLLPGLSRAMAERQRLAMESLSSSDGDAAKVSAARAAGALALRSNGRVVLAAAPGASPSDYRARAYGGEEAWFSLTAERRGRGAAEAVAALASLAAAAGYAAAARGTGGRARPASRLTPGKDRREQGSSSRIRADLQWQSGRQRQSGSQRPAGRAERPADRPAGTEELAGILGKRPR